MRAADSVARHLFIDDAIADHRFIREAYMKFARRVYTIAGLIGLIELVPLIFLEARIGVLSPPPITHPEFYYGFVGVTLVWQIMFLMLARDPRRHRPLMPVTILEKAAYVFPMIVLVVQQRVAPSMLGFVVMDGVFGVLFLFAYVLTADRATTHDTRTAIPPVAR